MDPRSVDVLLGEVAPEVGAFCRRRVGRLCDPALSVDDVVQEALTAVALTLRTRGLERGAVTAYAIGVARHKIVDAFRASGTFRERRGDLPGEAGEWDAPDAAPGPDELAERSELAARARALLTHLPAHQARVLRLRILEGLDAAETARVLGTTPGAVRVAQHRALSTLRALLEEHGRPGGLIG